MPWQRKQTSERMCKLRIHTYIVHTTTCDTIGLGLGGSRQTGLTGFVCTYRQLVIPLVLDIKLSI